MSNTKWKYTDMPSLAGKIAIITGASTGLGKQTALELARHQAHVFMLGRTPEKTKAAMEEIKSQTGNTQVEFLQCDLMQLSSVEACAKEFLSRQLPLHILVNNAGIMAVPFELSKDGIESQFATNHFAHFLLTMRLLPALERSTPSRIVNLSSSAHRFASGKGGIKFDLLNDAKQYSPWGRYGETKLANILFSKELDRRLQERGVQNVLVNACHPGVVRTELTRNVMWFPNFLKPVFNLFTVSVETGALTQTYLASAPEIEQQTVRGEYFEPTCKKATPIPNGSDMALAAKLWQWTEEILKEKYPAYISEESK